MPAPAPPTAAVAAPPQAAPPARNKRTGPRTRPAFAWTEDAHALAVKLHRLDLTPAQIGLVLGTGADVVKRKFRGVKFAPRNSVPTTRRVLSEKEIRLAESMYAYGIPKMHIERLLKVSGPVLERCAGDRMAVALSLTNTRVAGFLFNEARKGSVQAQIFWLKARGGDAWKETQHVSIEGTVGVLVAPGAVGPEVWIAAEAQRSALLAPGATSGGAGTEGVKAALVDQVRTVEEPEDSVPPWEVEGDDIEKGWVAPYDPGELVGERMPRTIGEEAEAAVTDDPELARMLGL